GRRGYLVHRTLAWARITCNHPHLPRSELGTQRKNSGENGDLEWNENGTLPSGRPRLEVPEESVSMPKLCRVVGEETRKQQWVRGATRHNFSGGIAAEIMWRQLRQAEFRSVVLHNMPDHSVSHEIAPDLPSPTNTPKQFPTANAGRGDPL